MKVSAQTCRGRSGQQDGPHRVGHDVARGSVPASAGRRLTARGCRGFKGKQEMAIGRTVERRNPFIPVAVTGRAVVWMSLADPIWASGQGSRVKGRTHDRSRTKASLAQTYLNPAGRPHMV